MQVTLRWARPSAIIAASLALTLCATVGARPKPIPIEVWSGGDDGMTARLRDEIEDAFKSSSDFTLSSGKKLGTLIISIPTHVRWKQIGGRTIVYYTITFATVDDHVIGARKGSCPDDNLSKCADQIAKDAKVAARKIH